MAKYRIDYQLNGLGNFFVEAPSLALAYEEMYKRFNADNSLIVHAKYPYGFEILAGVENDGEFPKVSKIRVTSLKDLRLASQGGDIDHDVPKPPKFAETGLFEFEDESKPE